MDKKRDHIDNKIASSFNSQERKAPAGLWSGISASVDLSADEIAIKEGFKNAQMKQAPKKGWTNVNKQLIIDEVWNNILAFQERRKRRVIIWWWSGSLGYLFLLFGLTWNYISDDTTRFNEEKSGLLASYLTQTKEGDGDNVESSTDNDIQESNHGNGSISSEFNNSDRTIPALAYITSDSERVVSDDIISDSEINAELISTNESGIDRLDRSLSEQESEIPSGDIDRLTVLQAQYIESNHEKELAELIIPDLTPFRRFEVGINLSGGNTWVFNNDVKNGFNRNSLIHNKLSTGYSIGVEGFYNFNSRHSMLVGYDSYSIHQQNYSYYQSGHLNDKNITLKQQKAILGYKISFMDRAYNKRNFVIRAGAFFAHSIEEQTQVNYVNNTPNSAFEKIDYGINLGGGVEHKFFRFKFEYGIRSDIGIHNMTASSENLPKKFDYATSFMLGGYVSLRYKL